MALPTCFIQHCHCRMNYNETNCFCYYNDLHSRHHINYLAAAIVQSVRALAFYAEDLVFESQSNFSHR